MKSAPPFFPRRLPRPQKTFAGSPWLAPRALAWVFAVSLLGCHRPPQPPQPAAGTVEQLPVESFNEYRAGSIPPHPWRAIGDFPEGVKLALDPSAESKFVGNAVTGKGVLLQDSSTSAGSGCGLEFPFASPPPGKLYLGFDFKLSAGDGLDWACELSGANGAGLALRIGENGELSAGQIGGPMSRVAPVQTGTWYHVSANISENGEAVVSLLESGDKNQPIKSGPIPLPTKSADYRKLKFFAAGSPERTGEWALDNVLMAGKVDAPRTALFPFTPAPLAELRASPKKVYAYYYEIYPSGYSDKDPGLAHYTKKLFNPSLAPADRAKAGTELLYRPLPRPQMAGGLSADEVLGKAMEEEVRLAIQMGLDGFLLDFFALPESYPDAANIKEYNRRSFALMDAAARVDPGFKIIPAVYAGPKPPPGLPPDQDVEEAWTAAYADSPILRKILSHPQILRDERGRVYLSKWGTELYPARWWKRVLDRLESAGTPAAFLGQFNGLTADRLKTYSPICYAMADWGPRTPKEYRWVEKARPLTTKVISPVVFQDVRTRERVLWESCGSDAFRNMWKAAIDDGADWVFITTWSDYSEQAQAPSTAFGFSIYDLNAYYTQWFKLGAPPKIDRDTLYYFYRIHHSGLQPEKGEKWKVIPEGDHTQAKDEIELLAFLEAPGQLQIRIGDEVHSTDAPAGITSFKVPLPPGRSFVPHFSLLRNGKPIFSGPGQYAILDKVEYPNMLYHGGMVLPDAIGPQ